MENTILIAIVFGLSSVNATHLVKNAELLHNNAVEALQIFVNQSIQLKEKQHVSTEEKDKKHLKNLEKKFLQELSKSFKSIPKNKMEYFTRNLPSEIESELNWLLKRNKKFEQTIRLVLRSLIREDTESLMVAVDDASTDIASEEIEVYEHFLKLFGEETLKPSSINLIPEKWGTSSAQHNIYVIYTRIILPTQLKFIILCDMLQILRKKYRNESSTECTYSFRDVVDIAAKIEKIMPRQSREFSKYYPLLYNVTKSGSTYTALSSVFRYYILPGFNHLLQRKDYHKKIKRDISWQPLFIARSLNNPRCSGELRDCHQPPDDMFICDPIGDHSYGPAIFRKKILDRKYACPPLDVRDEELPCPRGNGTTLYGVIKTPRDLCDAYEVCTCEDLASDIDRHFSLRSVTSDVGKNRVITGVRFKKVQYVIHIQIQHGRITMNGAIDEKSLEWKPLDILNPLDHDVEEGQDFHTVSYNKNYICTGQIIADDTIKDSYSALTGLKFVIHEDAGLTAIELHAQITPYSKRHSLLEPNRSWWIGPRSGDENKKRRFLVNSEIFEDAQDQSSHCVPFVLSEYDFDRSQSIVPQIDIRKVAPYPAIPLVGVGVFHNREKHGEVEIHGGLFSLKVYTPDFLRRKQFL